MAGTRTQNTQSEGLMSVLQQLAALKAAPDANLDEISTLEGQILQIIKRPQQEALARLAQAGGVVPGMGQQGGMSPGGAPMGPSGGAPMMGGGGPAGVAGGPGASSSNYQPWGVTQGNPIPGVDELRRLVASSRLA